MKIKTTEYNQPPLQTEPSNDREIGLAVNTEPRCFCVIAADCSGSMDGSPIIAVKDGLQTLKENLVADALACLRVELALITFNNTVKAAVDFCSPENFDPPRLNATGGTRLGAAILKGLEMINARRAECDAAGVPCYRPWLIVMTDGKPTDDISEAARRVKEAESKKHIAYFGIGVQEADMDALGAISTRAPLHLEGLKFTELFEWLSVNLGSVSGSTVGDQVPLTPPTWASV